jgi:hypothetical protein
MLLDVAGKVVPGTMNVTWIDRDLAMPAIKTTSGRQDETVFLKGKETRECAPYP